MKEMYLQNIEFIGKKASFFQISSPQVRPQDSDMVDCTVKLSFKASEV